MRLPAIALIALTLATPAAAQMAYRNVFPDGRVVYTDRPLAGAEQQSTIAPPPPAAAAAAPAPAPAAASAPDPAPASAEGPAAAVPGARWPPPPDAAQPMPVAATAAAPALEPAAPVAGKEPAAQPAPDRIAMLAGASEDVRAAERYLAAANATLEAGREPLPGERTGLARGGSRLNESYWDRQRQLETAVADAQARLDRAVAERNAAR
ncbi:MAG TPA: hypothetical protein VJM14_08860 [Burkholderiales bacterium]|nr:hypothetical protein [Burkholderiales bacterium]